MYSKYKNNLTENQIKRQTKIVATIGPATHSIEMLEKMIDAGINVARLNMSHGDHKEHGERIKNIRKASLNTKSEIAILMDLSGPKIRTGEVENDELELKEGKKIIITTKEVIGNDNYLTIKYPKLLEEVKEGGIIMLDDGRRKLEIEKIDKEKKEIICKIIIGGKITGRRGVNLPGANLSISSITKKDEEDLAFGIKNNVDYIAISFVKNAQDVRKLKSLFPKNFSPIIISKIETEEALANIDDILDESHGIMVARGDLAIEVAREKIPVIQKTLNQKAREKRKLVITATQMLESMIKLPVPTRAEVSDIANAIYDGTDAVMLSEESAKGQYPVEAVKMMADIAEATDPFTITSNKNDEVITDEKDSLKKHATNLAEEIDAKVIVSLTETGSTPRTLSSFKRKKSIIAITNKVKAERRMAIYRGVWPIVADENINDLKKIKEDIKKILKAKKVATAKDKIIVVSGMTFNKSGASNMIFVDTI